MYRQLAAAVWIASALADLSAQRRSTMKLELVLHRDLFLTGENIDVDVQLTNNGQTAVDAPILDSPQNAQPVYRLQGPAYPGGVTFNLRDSRRPGGSSAGADTALHRLAPGLMMAGAL